MIARGGAGRDPEVQRLLDQALDDQKSSWDRGERTPVEDYLARDPALREDAEAVLDLVFHEYLLRRERHEDADPHEFCERFPALAESLMIQLGIDAAIEPTTQILDGHEPAHPADLPLIQSLDGLEIIDVLGQGGMGVVYRARDPRLGRIVAVKTIAEGRHARPEQLARFRAEAQAVARLRHPNIIAIYAIGEHENQPYLSLEFAEGASLAQRLAEKPMGPREAAEVLETLARAAHVAHEAGVVHRDLKPSNILFAADGVPKVCDFGLAKLLDSDSGRTLSGQIVGTPSYMAPEQAEGHARQVGPAADVHALGAILYQALTGRPPFLGESAVETLNLVASKEAVPPHLLRPDIPRDLETICLKCLEKSPARRYATALALADDLRRFQRGEPILARRIGVLERSRKWTRRHPWQTASAAVVLVAASAFIGQTYRHNIELRAEVTRTQGKAAEARRNYLEARSAIQAMLARLSDGRVTGVPRLLELRREQREDALAFYDRILSRIDSNDPIVRADTARALSEASLIQYGLGHADEAEKSVRRALSLIKGLRSERPDDVEYMERQVECLVRLAAYAGTLAERAGHSTPDEAIVATRESVDLAERVARATPDNLARQELRALCHQNLGNALLNSGRNKEAKVHYRKAIEIREGIDPSKLHGVTQRLAEALINEGLILWGEKNYPLADKTLHRSEKLLLNLSPEQRDPKGNLDVALGKLYVTWSGMLLMWERFDDAIVRADAGLKRVEPYRLAEPNDANARATCLQLYGNRGYALAHLNKHPESAAAWTRVVELSTSPVPAAYRIRLGIELAQAGELDRALTQANLVRSASDVSGEDCYNVACLYSLSAAAARKDDRLAPGQRERSAKDHISDGLRWLKAAAEAGLFCDTARRDYANKDADLAILRDLPEFRRLIENSESRPRAESEETSPPAGPPARAPDQASPPGPGS